MNIEHFGKDHWSTFAYAETCCVDDRGRLVNERLRINGNTHPVRDGSRWQASYGTRIRGGGICPDHDDIDCLDDLEEAGLLEQVGTMINPVIRFTDEGQAVAAKLRAHKMNGGNFATFEVA